MVNTEQRHKTTCKTHNVDKPYLKQITQHRLRCEKSHCGVFTTKGRNSIRTIKNPATSVNTSFVGIYHSVDSNQLTPVVNHSWFWPLIECSNSYASKVVLNESESDTKLQRYKNTKMTFSNPQVTLTR